MQIFGYKDRWTRDTDIDVVGNPIKLKSTYNFRHIKRAIQLRV